MGGASDTISSKREALTVGVALHSCHYGGCDTTNAPPSPFSLLLPPFPLAPSLQERQRRAMVQAVRPWVPSVPLRSKRAKQQFEEDKSVALHRATESLGRSDSSDTTLSRTSSSSVLEEKEGSKDLKQSDERLGVRAVNQSSSRSSFLASSSSTLSTASQAVVELYDPDWSRMSQLSAASLPPTMPESAVAALSRARQRPASAVPRPPREGPSPGPADDELPIFSDTVDVFAGPGRPSSAPPSRPAALVTYLSSTTNHALRDLVAQGGAGGRQARGVDAPPAGHGRVFDKTMSEWVYSKCLTKDDMDNTHLTMEAALIAALLFHEFDQEGDGRLSGMEAQPFFEYLSSCLDNESERRRQAELVRESERRAQRRFEMLDWGSQASVREGKPKLPRVAQSSSTPSLHKKKGLKSRRSKLQLVSPMFSAPKVKSGEDKRLKFLRALTLGRFLEYMHYLCQTRPEEAYAILHPRFAYYLEQPTRVAGSGANAVLARRSGAGATQDVWTGAGAMPPLVTPKLLRTFSDLVKRHVKRMDKSEEEANPEAKSTARSSASGTGLPEEGPGPTIVKFPRPFQSLSRGLLKKLWRVVHAPQGTPSSNAHNIYSWME